MRFSLNWVLVGLGGIMIIAEILLGAVTGFDLALTGACVAIGGAVGLVTGSVKIGLFSAGALAIAYVAFVRGFVRKALLSRERPSNVDAVMGRTGVVTVRIPMGSAGEVKVDDETWRAVLAEGATSGREEGSSIIVVGVDGVTLVVK